MHIALIIHENCSVNLRRVSFHTEILGVNRNTIMGRRLSKVLGSSYIDYKKCPNVTHDTL